MAFGQLHTNVLLCSSLVLLSFSLFHSFCSLFPVFKLCACAFSSKWKKTGRSLFLSCLFAVFVDILMHFPLKLTHTHTHIKLRLLLSFFFLLFFLVVSIRFRCKFDLLLLRKNSQDTVASKLCRTISNCSHVYFYTLMDHCFPLNLPMTYCE